MILIYKLTDPITNKIRYVGKTKNGLNARLAAHLNYNGDNIKLRMWIGLLKQNGLKPTIELIEMCKEYNWCVREQYWIDELIKENDLLNIEVNENNVYFILRQYQAELIRMDYSRLTLKNYSENFFMFMVAFKKHPKEVTKTQIINYLQSLVEEKKISNSYQNCIINAIKFYYEKVLGLGRETYYIKRPRKEYKIPVLFSYEQVVSIISSVKNFKQRTALQIMYSCAMRSSEPVALLTKNIDFENNLITIIEGKGKKDRIVSVPKITMNMVKEYVNKYNPSEYLFAGQFEGEHYSQSSLQIVFRRAARALGIEGRPHDLRGSRLTHVMNSGVKIEAAANYSGHNSTKTIYKHYYRNVVKETQRQMEEADIKILNSYHENRINRING